MWSRKQASHVVREPPCLKLWPGGDSLSEETGVCHVHVQSRGHWVHLYITKNRGSFRTKLEYKWGHSVQNFFKRRSSVDTPRYTCINGIIGYRFAKSGPKSSKKLNLLKNILSMVMTYECTNGRVLTICRPYALPATFTSHQGTSV